MVEIWFEECTRSFVPRCGTQEDKVHGEIGKIVDWKDS